MGCHKAGNQRVAGKQRCAAPSLELPPHRPDRAQDARLYAASTGWSSAPAQQAFSRRVAADEAWMEVKPVERLRGLFENDMNVGTANAKGANLCSSDSIRAREPKRSSIPVEALSILTQDKDAWNRRWAAAHLQIPVDILCALAQDKEASVRCAVAAHPNTPVMIFHRLCLDPDEWVRCSVAGNPYTPVEILRTLVQDEHALTRAQVASHLQTPGEILRLLAQDEDERPGRGWIGLFSIETQLDEVAALEVPEHLRHVLIAALATDWKGEHTFAVTDKRDAATLLRDRLIFYKHLLAPFLSPIALRKLACSLHWEVRYLMALHKHTLWETRQALSQDENRYVRAMARAKTAQIKEERAD